MFVVDKGRWSKNSNDWIKAAPLFKEVFGYTDEDIKNFIKVQEQHYFPPLAMNVSLEQAKLIIQPFWDNGLNVFIEEYDDNTFEHLDFGNHITRLGVVVNRPPQSHYYDKPIIREDQKIDPFNPPTFDRSWIGLSITGYTGKQNTSPVVTCPYCKSTDTKKISGLSKVGSVALFGIFALGKTTKQWHCNSCKSDF